MTPDEQWLIGKIFGVLRIERYVSRGAAPVYICHCLACGGEHEANNFYLSVGGCLAEVELLEKAGLPLVKVPKKVREISYLPLRPGEDLAPVREDSKRQPMYAFWSRMIARCHDRSHQHYPDFGGRGIKVCLEWHDFKVFRWDIGGRPQGYSLRRIDPQRGYSPDNCRWSKSKKDW